MRTESNAQSDRNIANFLLRDDHVIAYGLRHEYLTLWLMRMWTGVQAEPDALVPHDLCLKSSSSSTMMEKEKTLRLRESRSKEQDIRRSHPNCERVLWLSGMWRCKCVSTFFRSRSNPFESPMNYK
jgi:hypothetical protein